MAFGDTDIVSEAGAREALRCAAAACVTFASFVILELLWMVRIAGLQVWLSLPMALLVLIAWIPVGSFACAARFAAYKGEHTGYLMLATLLATVLATAYLALPVGAIGVFAVIPIGTLALVVCKLVQQGMRGARNLREPSPEFFE
ncbi:hypothetical protein [Sphingomonas sp. IC081]|uniref:hypothetical protein n=1 Tax=Sphingomonas sp. IC081 TaxID=304378 RepID=UPI001156D2FD|nr:hypothetical protein [Sphingomonas sp. IC081]QDK32433.1 hypothetical protein DM450_06465 [Sphingomonas sp. IC081]